MRKQLRLIAAAAWLLPAAVLAADIQQVAASACGQEGCCNMKDCQSCAPACCPTYQNGACCIMNGGCLNGGCYGIQAGGCQYGYCANCPGGHCANGQCSTADVVAAHCTNWCHPCGPVGTAARMHVPGAKALVWCGHTKAAPDAGWAPPARMPIYHTGSGFGSWYGNQGPFVGGAPMVYQPTDTAQLGFSYANTPYWRPDPTRIPPVPQPSMFHMRAFVNGGHHRHGRASLPPMYGHPLQGAACPVSVSGTPMTGIPVAMPRPAAGVPTAAMMRPGAVQMSAAQPAMQPAVQTVSNQMPRAAAPSGPVSQKTRTSKPAPKLKQPGGRSGRSTARKSSGGWFGLPSLSEMRF